MFVAIFKAKIKELDELYNTTAAKLRDLAISEYNCAGFVSVTENGLEISISYWHSLDDIRKWKNNPIHQDAQVMGRQKYYKSYEVQIAKVDRQYGFDI